MVRVDLKGGDKYTAEFLIDQRKCDMFSVLGAALNMFEQDKEKSGFRITNFTAYQNENVTTIQLEFDENVGDKKKRKFLNYKHRSNIDSRSGYEGYNVYYR